MKQKRSQPRGQCEYLEVADADARRLKPEDQRALIALGYWSARDTRSATIGRSLTFRFPLEAQPILDTYVQTRKGRSAQAIYTRVTDTVDMQPLPCPTCGHVAKLAVKWTYCPPKREKTGAV